MLSINDLLFLLAHAPRLRLSKGWQRQKKYYKHKRWRTTEWYTSIFSIAGYVAQCRIKKYYFVVCAYFNELTYNLPPSKF
jgi:hypothetical protein